MATTKYQDGGWYNGRQYNAATNSFGDVGVINNPNQQGYGQAVSAEVNKQSAAAQGVSTDTFNKYLQTQVAAPAPQNTQTQVQNLPQGIVTPGNTSLDTGQSSMSINSPTTPNLTELYKTLQTNSGVSDKEAQITAAEKKFLEARNIVSDNPFLSASMQDNRLRRLRQQYETEVSPLKNDVAMKKADIETQMNLQTQQFTIDSQAAQQALSQFNTLLESGALNNASGADIANITRSTGMSSGMIQAAVNAAKTKNLSVQSYDDGVNQYFVAVDPSGNIVNKQLVGKSKSTKSGGGFDAESFMKLLQDQTNKVNELDTLAEDSLKPQISPSKGVGTVYAEPNTGINWIYTQSGWQRG
jgi:hypothetical protein